ncbi:hypothetical protein [Bacillus salipaludis]|uniref:Uncharacterized protein n=1 Tax=Bacillus salipaludis TaxID=2547811 RepID=A0AA90TC15_9BACI|nr:hypothetical protein [Bacillus salipaludis]MDQ6596757.1 hypothetical protein [Bacillus salipaludis]
MVFKRWVKPKTHPRSGGNGLDKVDEAQNISKERRKWSSKGG